MSRLLAAALATLLLLSGTARAQAAEGGAPAAEAPPAAPDARTQAEIRRAIEQAKEELRDEIRAEMQGAQSAAEFMGAVAEGPRLEFLELDGYYRLRGQLMTGFDLDRGLDAAGFPLFPYVISRGDGGSLASANMRFRVEPTLNVSEHVRIRAQLDVLDNYVLGSTRSALFDADRSPYPVPFFGATRRLHRDDPGADRDAILPKRAWGEVQTPVGLLSFGRMPSGWGLGILTNAGLGLDDDYGDTVDRIQFALPPVQTPIGRLTFVPILDFDSEGVLYTDPRFGGGFGQPFDADPSDDARTYALKVARVDTDDEIRRRLERGEASVNYGAYYNYRTQRFTFPGAQLLDPSTDPATGAGIEPVRRGAYAHVLDLWARVLTGRWRVEAEAVGVSGVIGETFALADPADPLVRTTLGRVLLRQWGAVLRADYQITPSRLVLGAELGVASGDSAPGFGNVPDRLAVGEAAGLPAYGSVEGPQYGQPGDRSIRNFRFNPAYQVDLILWRGILGQVTDAWYLKPTLRWTILPGLVLDGALVYSQAIYSESTPSAVATGDVGDLRYGLQDRGSKPLGIEADGRLTLDTGSGFVAWTELGVFQPMGGGLGEGLSRAWALNFGLAARF